jgi:hypothetical protein
MENIMIVGRFLKLTTGYRWNSCIHGREIISNFYPKLTESSEPLMIWFSLSEN